MFIDDGHRTPHRACALFVYQGELKLYYLDDPVWKENAYSCLIENSIFSGKYKVVPYTY